MSFSEEKEIKCPKCGHMNTIYTWNSITAKDDPDLKEDILTRRINIMTCAECGQTALVGVPLLYSDDDKKLMIYFAPCSGQHDKTVLYNDLKKRAKDEIKDLKDTNLRFVTQYNELLEKILIFDAGLHDKTIEFLKMMILLQEPKKAENRLVMFGKSENGYIEFMVQDKSENQVYTSNIPMQTYSLIEQQLADSGVKFKSTDWEIVDLDYSSKLLTGINNE